MLTIPSILRICQTQKTGTLLRFCSEEAVKEIKRHSSRFPRLRIEITDTEDFGTCVTITPQSYKKDHNIIEDSKVVPRGQPAAIVYK